MSRSENFVSKPRKTKHIMTTCKDMSGNDTIWKYAPYIRGCHATKKIKSASGKISSWDCVADKPPPVESELGDMQGSGGSRPHDEEVSDVGQAEQASPGSGSSTSTSGSVTTSESSGDEADMVQHVLPPVPEATWRVGCSTWQHRKTKTLHLLAAEGKDIFVCGRVKSDAHVEAEGRPTLLSMRCSQCDKGKHIKSTAQLVHELDLKRQKRF